MKLKEIKVKEVLDSRREKTIQVIVKTASGTFNTSSPSGKSIGKFETPVFNMNIKNSINILNSKIEQIKQIDFEHFISLEELEKVMGKKDVGANILFALEACILKALAAREGKELWEYLNSKARKFPMPVGNIIEGGLHSRGKNGKKPDFQEYLIIPRTRKFFDANYIMKYAHKVAGERLKLRNSREGFSDEKGWVTSLTNNEALEVLNETREEIISQLNNKIEIGVDIAASEIYTGYIYNYQNPVKRLKPMEQVDYILNLAEKYRVGYLEDPLDQNDFANFRILRNKINKIRPCLIVGDDLTATQITRFKKAMKERSINSIIVKVNQNGSLIDVKKIIDLAKISEIAIVFSHRSGETMDSTISDLAFAWGADFVKFGAAGKERDSKLNRLIEIEKKV
ncbi:MAG: hypothetical protein ABIH72_00940 [archaeon]